MTAKNKHAVSLTHFPNTTRGVLESRRVTNCAKVNPLPERDEYGFGPGEALNARCARLDEELAAARANIGARGEPAEPLPRPVLDERLPGLWLDAWTPIVAASASAATGAPYTAMRAAMNSDEDYRDEFARAAQRAAAHSPWFAMHRDEIELALGLTAITAAHFDTMLTLADAECVGAGLEPKSCSKHDAWVVGLIVLAPVLLMVGFAIYKLVTKKG